jgi:2-polyprenyl-6-methoxyphenol hydroxylase-like FAD-dependent oxidoreductase
MLRGGRDHRLNVAVAGGGPAGLAAAVMLKRAGHAVSLYERFAAPEPVGSGLMIQPTGLAVLDALGLGEALRDRAAEIDRLLGKTASGKVVLDVRYSALGPQRGFGVHRAALFDILHQAALAEGVPIQPGATVRASFPGPHGRTLEFAERDAAGPFDLVVDALGHASPLAPPTGRNLAYGALWASLDWPDDGDFQGRALEQRYHRASIMAGVLPIGRTVGRDRPQAAFFWSLRADRLQAWRAEGLAGWKATVERLWPQTRSFLDQIAVPEQLTFACYAHRTVRPAYASGLAHIGDAWRSTSPQLGQGANMAMLDAYALALAIAREADLDAALRLYQRLRRGHVELYQLLSLLLTPAYQSDGRLLPLLRDHLVGPLSKLWPATTIQAAMVSGLAGGPLRKLGLQIGAAHDDRDDPIRLPSSHAAPNRQVQ